MPPAEALPRRTARCPFDFPSSRPRASITPAPWLRRAPPLRFDEAVVEIKGQDEDALPHRLAALGRFAQPWSANSKYAAAVEALDLVPSQ